MEWFDQINKLRLTGRCRWECEGRGVGSEREGKEVEREGKAVEREGKAVEREGRSVELRGGVGGWGEVGV